MPFSKEVIEQAWARSGGQCECERQYLHIGRCSRKLSFNKRGLYSLDGWEAYHLVPEFRGGKDTIENCEILCMICYERAKIANIR